VTLYTSGSTVHAVELFPRSEDVNMAAILFGVMNHPHGGETEVEQVAERTPDAGEILLSSYLRKGPAFDESAAFSEWRPIFCALTESSFFLSIRKADQYCVDRIPLREITDIESKSADYSSAGHHHYAL